MVDDTRTASDIAKSLLALPAWPAYEYNGIKHAARTFDDEMTDRRTHGHLKIKGARTLHDAFQAIGKTGSPATKEQTLALERSIRILSALVTDMEEERDDEKFLSSLVRTPKNERQLRLLEGEEGLEFILGDKLTQNKELVIESGEMMANASLAIRYLRNMEPDIRALCSKLGISPLELKPQRGSQGG